MMGDIEKYYTYVLWANGDSFVAFQHTRDDYRHLSGALESQHVWFLQHNRDVADVLLSVFEAGVKFGLT